jgi:DNA polymerase-4
VVLITLVDRVAQRLRAAKRACRTVVLRLRFDDFTRITRSYTMTESTQHTQTILAAATGLLRLCRPAIRRRGLTLLGISLSNLCDHTAIQLRLPFDRTRSLDCALDEIRTRYGNRAITRGILLGRDPGPWVPLLPD